MAHCDHDRHSVRFGRTHHLVHTPTLRSLGGGTPDKLLEIAGVQAAHVLHDKSDQGMMDEFVEAAPDASSAAETVDDAVEAGGVAIDDIGGASNYNVQ